MPSNRMSIRIGGEAGQGVESGGAGFAKALVRGGLYVFGLQDYMSRIRGGHNFYQIRVAEQPLYAFEDDVHLLLAFNKETVDLHLPSVVPGGAIVHDSATKADARALAEREVKDFELPLVKLAEEHGGHKIMMNTAALGATAGVTGYSFERIVDIIERNFKRKGSQTVKANLAVARAAYELAGERYAADYAWKLSTIPGAPQRMLVNGNQALALGAIAAGCQFISSYPMTPASSITEWLATHSARFGIVQKQTEDELSAILMAIGASHAGVRAMTATSGGGFCLMVEAYGLAAMTETPLVIVEVQRGGPSTGLPTRTGQEDLEFALSASHGEFPRLVIAPGTVEQCFEAGYRAFNLADRYQGPVIVLSDTFLSSQGRTLDKSALDFDRVTIDRGQYLDYQALDALAEPYQRHAVTESGVSPRAVPGHPNAVWITTGDEHTEEGVISSEDAVVRRAQMEKRMRKQALAAREMRLPSWYGPAEAELTLVGFGSTWGSIREAVDTLNAQGLSANGLQFVDMYPLDEDALAAELDRAGRLVAVEQNFTGQLANHIRRLTGRKVDARVNKYDGRPISPLEIVSAVAREVAARV
ncbi:MAG: 2-oxoacid:acceptor oxidoreductase subunit alpha [Chloroflexi bacterium]|nr:2-oxoacid:acceptor oxidoreductase subunit alpha [Chloroflexota bacterium]